MRLFGGPIAHKTFFFVNYEGFRHIMADTMTDTLPTAAEVMGDFSRVAKISMTPQVPSPILRSILPSR